MKRAAAQQNAPVIDTISGVVRKVLFSGDTDERHRSAHYGRIRLHCNVN